MPQAPLMSHVSVGATHFDQAIAFYDAVLGTLGAKRTMEVPDIAIAYGREFPEFWVGRPHDGETASVGNGVHFGFSATSKADVDAFYQAALAHGGKGDGAPGPREHYGPQYYGAFVRDPEGNKIEAMYWDHTQG